MTTRKVLISPGYGAGWSTWQSDRAAARFSLFYQPIIDFLEAGGKFERNNETHPVLVKFLDDLKAETGDRHFYLGGTEDLMVAAVDGQFKVNEYDGYETVMLRDEEDWY